MIMEHLVVPENEKVLKDKQTKPTMMNNKDMSKV